MSVASEQGEAYLFVFYTALNNVHMHPQAVRCCRKGRGTVVTAHAKASTQLCSVGNQDVSVMLKSSTYTF